MMAHMSREVEVRSFITDQEFGRLKDYFDVHADFEGQDEQVTYYFDAPQDVRIQRNSSHAKIWYKGGKLHDQSREEIEVKFALEDFEKMEGIFAAMGFGVKIKWFRQRLSYSWQGVNVALDNTRGYGRILELEIMAQADDEVESLEKLKNIMSELGVVPTPRETFEISFKDYETNWRSLIQDA